MIKEAIYSDGTKEYCNPMEPYAYDEVTIRLRVAHSNRLEIYMVTEDGRFGMVLERSEDVFDYYRATFRMPDKRIYYYFEIHDGNQICYYDRFGANDNYRSEYRFSITPGFSTPDWAKGAVMYQIYVDRFSNGDPDNDVETDEYFYIKMHSQNVTNWDQNPANFGVCEFYGGDLEGVRQKLYYLKSLGVDVIYLNPIFVSPSNHKYDIADYDYVDPHYGKIIADGGDLLDPSDNDNSHASKYKKRVTDLANLKASNAFFAQFVEEAHQRGIRVILDGVFNHCGSFNKWLDREGIYDKDSGYEPGAYQSADSPYHDYFQWHDDNRDLWPHNGTYDGWWGHDTLPKLNYEGSEKLYNYILEIGKKWVSPPYNCDGWRLDVAADLGHTEEFNHKFWRDFRAAVKSANPDAVVLAEHYGDPSAWLGGDQWDTIMNYDAFMEPISYFLTGMEKHSDSFDGWALGDGERFRDTMLHFMTRLMPSSLYCSMNQLSNHDHSRFLTRTNHKVGRVADLGSEKAGEDVSIPIMKLGVLMQMTWPGAPTLYYGDEAGVVGFTDPDNRRTYPWGHANYELIDFHRDVISLHKSSSAIKRGSFKFLLAGRGYVAYARFNSLEQEVIVINVTDHDIDLDIPVWHAGVPMNCVMRQNFMTNLKGYSIMPVRYNVEAGMLKVKIGSTTGLVFEH